MFLKEVNNHARACLLYDPSHFVLQGLKYLDYIDYYHERIRMFHVKMLSLIPQESKAFTAAIKAG
jgi:sugar phosphate isomerase/epimerase